MLLTNGAYAEKVKTLLQRCRNVRLDNLALSVGRRKNDSASLMAESAGGQAVALLSMCLMNLFKHSDAGLVMARLCSKLLSASMNLASVSRLSDVAKLLAGKLDTLGFGNLLASEVTKIHKVYVALDLNAPEDLLEPLDVESTTELLIFISRALREEGKLCRVTGSHGMGHILGLVQALFPRVTALTVEGTVIQSIEDPKVRIEITSCSCCEPTRIHLETVISTATAIELPINVRVSAQVRPSTSGAYRFHWPGWLADFLQLNFLSYGVNCGQEILDACCELLMLIPEAVHIYPTVPANARYSDQLKLVSLLEMLGPSAKARMYVICETTWRSRPILTSTNRNTAFAKVKAVVTNAIGERRCSCPKGTNCGWLQKWTYNSGGQTKQTDPCVLHYLWNVIGVALFNGIWCFFIDAGPNAVVTPQRLWEPWWLTSAVNGNLENMEVESFVASVMGVVAPAGCEESDRMALSSDSGTIYPAILSTLSVPVSQGVIFNLVEGQLVYEGRYHRNLRAKAARPRSRATRSLQTNNFTPSHIGVHVGSPLVSIREGFESLEVACHFQYGGSDVEVNLKSVILGYIGMRWSTECPHQVTDHLRLPSVHKAYATSVASPSGDGAIGVAMTRWNPTAQLLCCEFGYQAVLQRFCCLNCALQGLAPRPSLVLIVG